jgi:catechol 2,3-dioxygenase-like lactoylglutathione lyase family enzyme
MSTAKPTLEQVQPVLMCRDVEASVRFYERLGFTRAFVDDPDDPKYAGVRRERVELHLQWQDASQWDADVDRPTYRFPVRDPDALFAEFVERGVAGGLASGDGPWAAPADTPWGTREFHLRDPGGNGLQFYAPADRARHPGGEDHEQ